MFVEVCANSFQSAINAQNAGADRIELCSELAVGGITPSYGLLKEVMQILEIPVNVLIRPRSGNFSYSEEEFNIMKEDILLCKELGCAGIVSGVLKEDNTIDVERTKELVELAKPLSFTFHRAFDWTPNAINSFKELSDIGVDRILTSGQHKAAVVGFETLQELLKISDNKTIIMPGGGIKAENILLFKEAGFKEIHFSGTAKPAQKEVKVPMNSGNLLYEIDYPVSDSQLLKKMIGLVK